MHLCGTDRPGGLPVLPHADRASSRSRTRAISSPCVQLPPGASLDRTEAVVKRAVDIILTTPGVEHVAPFAGLDATTFTVASNAGTIFSGLPSLYNHELKGVTAATVLADLRKRLSVIQDAYVLTIPPPPVQGLGSAGGFKMMVQDRAGLGSARAREGGTGPRRRRQSGSGLSPASSRCSAPARRPSMPISTARRPRRSGSRRPTSSTRCRSISARNM